MKKISLLFSVLAAMSLSSLAQNKTDQVYTTRTLTFEDADSKGIVNYGGGSSLWSSLIDRVQYNGPMLYPSSFDEDEDILYGWYDEGNTEITSEFTNLWVDGKFWGGGIAISNYVDDNIEQHGTYNYQLSVPVSNGSDNFAVVYCNAVPTIANGNPQTCFEFADGPHVIESILVSPTTYQLSAAQYGNSDCHSLLSEGDFLTVTFHGYNGQTPTGTVSFDLARDGQLLDSWQQVDLTPLQSVSKVLLTIDSNDKSPLYGVNHPSYFAFDDVVVRFVSEGTPDSITPSAGSNVLSVEYFSLSGQKLSAAPDALHIIKTTYTDGRVVTTKAIR